MVEPLLPLFFPLDVWKCRSTGELLHILSGTKFSGEKLACLASTFCENPVLLAGNDININITTNININTNTELKVGDTAMAWCKDTSKYQQYIIVPLRSGEIEKMPPQKAIIQPHKIKNSRVSLQWP